MQRLKIIYSLSLLLVLMLAVSPSIAQMMSTSIRDSAAVDITLQDPYCGGGYNLVDIGDISAENMHECPQITVTEIPANVVDWVLVELRAVTHGGTAGSTNVRSADEDTVIARKPAFLLSTGRIVDATYTGADPSACTDLMEYANCPDVLFQEGNITTEVETKDLYIAIRHRNHLDILSSASITGDNGTYTYNFDGSGQVYSGTPQKQINLAQPGESEDFVHVMISGDANVDGNVDENDYDDRIGPSAPNVNTEGYFGGDTNFDGNVDVNDFDDNIVVDSNRRGRTGNNGRGSLFP